MSVQERAEFADMVAQAVIDRMEERERVAGLVELVVQRVAALQREEAQLRHASSASEPPAQAEGE